MNEPEQEEHQQKSLPFDNLYLNTGLVSGFNDWWMYAVTILFTVLCYICAPVLTSLHLFVKAQEKRRGNG